MMRDKYMLSNYYGDEAPRIKDFIIVMATMLVLIAFSYLADHVKLFAGRPSIKENQQHLTVAPSNSSILEIHPFILKGFFLIRTDALCPRMISSSCISTT